MRIMALDIGDKRIGVAVSDELELSANGLLTIERTGRHKEMDRITDIIREYTVEEVIVGMPVMMDGSMGIQGEKVTRFAEELKKSVNVPVKFMDERLSTKFVEKMLIGADISRKKRRQVIDKLSAVVILQNYLDSRTGQQDRYERQ